MLQRMFLLLIMVPFGQSFIHSQDAEKSVSKNLFVYICGGSGNINSDTGTILNHWGEAGLAFSQNFATAPWLTVSTLVATCTGNSGMTKDGNGRWHATADNSMSGQVVGGYIKGSLFFDKYFTLSLHSQGRLDFDLRYPLLLPANQKLQFRAYYEILPTGNTFYLLPKNEDRPAGARSVLRHMDYRITYSIQFHKAWTYELDTRFRFNGGEDDSLEAVKNSFSVRLNNTFYYNNPNGFGGYLQLRYQPTNIATGKPTHNVYLNAGMSYSYDLSAL